MRFYILTQQGIDRFHYHATKKLIRNRSIEKDKNLVRHRKQIYKRSLQFSDLCGTTFVSYLLKRFTQL